jgi:hypothetical protein
MLVIQSVRNIDGDTDSVIFITVCMTVWHICFRHNFFKIYPHDLKMSRKTHHTIRYNLRWKSCSKLKIWLRKMIILHWVPYCEIIVHGVFYLIIITYDPRCLHQTVEKQQEPKCAWECVFICITLWRYRHGYRMSKTMTYPVVSSFFDYIDFYLNNNSIESLKVTVDVGC